jgi:hypothetical protein
MPAHPFGLGGLDNKTQRAYLNHLIAIHTDIQSQAEKCAYYAQLAGTRASVLKHLGKQITMTEEEVANALENCGDDEDAYNAMMSVDVTATEIGKDATLKRMVMTQLGMANWKACYVKLRCALADYDEWIVLEKYFNTVAAAGIKDCKVLN